MSWQTTYVLLPNYCLPTMSSGETCTGLGGPIVGYHAARILAHFSASGDEEEAWDNVSMKRKKS